MNEPAINWKAILKSNPAGLRKWLHSWNYLSEEDFIDITNDMFVCSKEPKPHDIIETFKADAKALQCMCWLDQQGYTILPYRISETSWVYTISIWPNEKEEPDYDPEKGFGDRTQAIAAGIEAAFKLLKS